MMNWYKHTQQQQLFNPEQFPATTKPLFDPNSIPDAQLTTDLLEDFNYESGLTNEQILQRHNVDFDVIDLAGQPYYVFDYNDTRYIVQQNGGEPEEAREWIAEQYDPFKYITTRDFNEMFWENTGLSDVVYHATPKDNVNGIMKRGLMVKCKTRGIGNRNIGCAVFASHSPDGIDSYGDAVFAIHIGKMKAAGFMPTVSQEEGFDEKEAYETLAHKIGIDDYYYEMSDNSLMEDTIVIYDNIPKQFISRYR